jgi:hypothetical protein
MKQISALAFAAVLALFIAASFSFGAGRADDEVSPIIGVIPTGYRQWELIAPAQEAEPLNELRSVLGIPTLLPMLFRPFRTSPTGTPMMRPARSSCQICPATGTALWESMRRYKKSPS